MRGKFDPAPMDKHVLDFEAAIEIDKKQRKLEQGLEDILPASDPLSGTEPRLSNT